LLLSVTHVSNRPERHQTALDLLRHVVLRRKTVSSEKTRWTPSAPPGPRSPAGPAARQGPGGSVEAIRALMVAKRSARAERTQTINQARSLIVTGPMTCGPGSQGTP
jgi:hypothetical protein